jgi:hypothetical protein
MYAEIKNVPLGYPSLAAFISKDNDFVIFRKFRQLNARNLLYLQAELTHLENEIETIDRGLAAANANDGLGSWSSFTSDKQRLDLIIQARRVLDEYSML